MMVGHITAIDATRNRYTVPVAIMALWTQIRAEIAAPERFATAAWVSRFNNGDPYWVRTDGGGRKLLMWADGRWEMKE